MSDPADKSEGEIQNDQGTEQQSAIPRTWLKFLAWPFSVPGLCAIMGIAYLGLAQAKGCPSLEPFANLAFAGCGLLGGFELWRYQKRVETRARLGNDLLVSTDRLEIALEKFRIAVGDDLEDEDRYIRWWEDFETAYRNWQFSLNQFDLHYGLSNHRELESTVDMLRAHTESTREDKRLRDQGLLPSPTPSDDDRRKLHDAIVRLSAKSAWPEGRIKDRYLDDEHSKVLTAHFTALKRLLKDWTSFR